MIQFHRAVFVLTVLFSASAQAELVTSTIELEGVRHIHLLGRHHLVISQGDREYVALTVDKQHLDEVEAQIKGEVLAVGDLSRSGWSWFRPSRRAKASIEVQLRDPRSVSNRGSGTVVINELRSSDEIQLGNHGSGSIRADQISAQTITLRTEGSGELHVASATAPTISIRIAGSGDTRVDQLESERLTIAVNGSADVDIGGGETTELDILVNGSGDVDTAALRSDRAQVTINGSGDVAVHADQALAVRVSGSGDVSYGGQPAQLDQRINGSGRVRPR